MKSDSSQIRERRSIPLWIIGFTSAVLMLASIILLSLFNNNSGIESSTQILSALEPKPVFGVVLDSNLQVVDIETGSSAQKANIQKGDKLKKMDGTLLTSSNQARQVLNDKVKGKENLSDKSLDLMVERAGQELSIKFIPAVPAAHPGPTPTAVPSNQYYF